MADEDDTDGRVTAIVVTGGAPLDARAVAALPGAALVVAADGGLDHALAAGMVPDLLVGDLDSVSAEALAWAEQHAKVLRHPADKAQTDTELALTAALDSAPDRLVLVAGDGDRLDHTLAAIGSLGARRLDGLDAVEAWWGVDRVYVVTDRRPVELTEQQGTTFSVLAMHGPCSGVSVRGARWPLDEVDLGPLVGWGVSNETLTQTVRVSVRDGVLTVILPGQPGRAAGSGHHPTAADRSATPPTT